MDNVRVNNNSASSPITRMIPVLIVFLGLIGLYYLYQYLFGLRTSAEYVLISKKQRANVDTVITVDPKNLPPLYEGAEFTVSTWIYLDNWSHRSGKNKAILILQGPGFDTLRLYLGAYKPKLYVRFHTKDDSNATPPINQSPDSATSDSLVTATRDSTFNTPSMDAGLLSSTAGCDLPEVDLQRWVNITVAVNGRTVDVYLDGKLSRSCVLPVPFKVDTRYTGKLLPYGGFGGQIAATMMYDTALHPEAVYKNYIAGPEPILSFWDWVTSFFTLDVNVTIDKSK